MEYRERLEMSDSQFDLIFSRKNGFWDWYGERSNSCVELYHFQSTYTYFIYTYLPVAEKPIWKVVIYSFDVY